MSQPIVRCCESMIHAHESGTDNEGYEELVVYYDESWPNGRPVGVPLIGDDLPPIQFCPWCGRPVVVEERP